MRRLVALLACSLIAQLGLNSAVSAAELSVPVLPDRQDVPIAVPAGVEVMGKLNVRRLAAAGFLEDILDWAPLRAPLIHHEFVQELGLDLVKLHHVWVFLYAQEQGLILASSDFDFAAMRQALKGREDAVILSDDRYRIGNEKGESQAEIALVKDGLIAFGTPSKVEQCLDLRQGAGEPFPSKHPKLGMLNASTKALALVVGVDGLELGADNPMSTMLEAVVLEGDATAQQLELAANLGCPDAEAANQLEGLLLGLVGLQRARIEDQPEPDPAAKALIDSLALTRRNDTSLRLAVRLTIEQAHLLAISQGWLQPNPPALPAP